MKRILVMAAMAFATTGFAQKVGNMLTFQKGQKLQMAVVVTSTGSTPMGDNKADATVIRIFDVQDANANGATIEYKTKRIQFNLESMMGSQAFDSEKPADMNGPAGKTVAKSLKNKYTMTVDATGKVTSVKKDDSNPNTQEDDPGADMLSAALAQLGTSVTLPQTGDRTDFAILPAYEVGKGDSWTDTVPDRKTVYTVADVTDREIVINYTENEEVHTTQNLIGTEVTMNAHNKTTGRIVLDRQTGLLKQKTGDTSSDGTINAMGQTAPTSQKIKRTWTVTAS